MDAELTVPADLEGAIDMPYNRYQVSDPHSLVTPWISDPHRPVTPIALFHSTTVIGMRFTVLTGTGMGPDRDNTKLLENADTIPHRM